MEKVMKEIGSGVGSGFTNQPSLFPEHHFQIEVVGDVAILRELLPQSMPIVHCSGTKKDIIDKLSDLMR